MFGSSLKIPKNILEKVRVASQIIGAASTDEFAAKVLETEADKVIASTAKKEVSAAEVEDIANKLKGLGYLE